MRGVAVKTKVLISRVQKFLGVVWKYVKTDWVHRSRKNGAKYGFAAAKEGMAGF